MTAHLPHSVEIYWRRFAAEGFLSHGLPSTGRNIAVFAQVGRDQSRRSVTSYDPRSNGGHAGPGRLGPLLRATGRQR